MGNQTVHWVVHFSGRVQGVGFRYSTLQAAKEFDVSGCVRNLPDGRVRLDAVGRDAEVRGFVDRVKDQLESYIREAELTQVDPPEVFEGFIIG